MPDLVALIRSLLPGGSTSLKADTIALMMTNPLPDGVWIRFPFVGELPDKGFGLAGSLILEASPQWWISPRANVAGLMMTQRQRAFGHPFAFEFKRLAYEAVKHKERSFENTMHESAIGTLFAFIGAKRKTFARISD